MAVRSYNKVMLIGNCAADPEIRSQQAQFKMVSVNVATNAWKQDGNGGYAQTTEWHRVKFWNYNADKALNTLRKGSRVYIEGRLNTNTYPDKNHPEVMHRTYEITVDSFVALDRRNGNEEFDQGNGQYNNNWSNNNNGGYVPYNGGGNNYSGFSQPQGDYNSYQSSRNQSQGYGNFNNGGGQNFGNNINQNNRNSNGMGGAGGNGDDVPF